MAPVGGQRSRHCLRLCIKRWYCKRVMKLFDTLFNREKNEERSLGCQGEERWLKNWEDVLWSRERDVIKIGGGGVEEGHIDLTPECPLTAAEKGTDLQFDGDEMKMWQKWESSFPLCFNWVGMGRGRDKERGECGLSYWLNFPSASLCIL